MREIAPGIILEWLAGYCPVQAEGTIDGVSFYFRARHTTISLGIGVDASILEPDWEWCERYQGGDDEAAGYLDHAEARAYLIRFATYYQQAIPGNGHSYWQQRKRERLEQLRREHPDWLALLPEEQQRHLLQIIEEKQ